LLRLAQVQAKEQGFDAEMYLAMKQYQKE
jgi:hypothetical protein